MTEMITLEEAKMHCRYDGDDEDSLFECYIAAALEVCQKHIGKQFDNGLDFPPAIKVGCLMYICFLFENREMVSSVGMDEVPLTISLLWSLYRDVGVY